MKSKITPRQLNKSLDERLLKPTDLIDALNVAIRTNEDGQGGVVKNAEANTPVDFLGADTDDFTGANYVIGSVSDDAVGVVYLFVYNSSDKHSIWAYSTEAKSYRLIFTSSLLNFPKNGFVSADFVKIKRVVEAGVIADSTQADTEGGATTVDEGDASDTGSGGNPGTEGDDDNEFDVNENESGCTDASALNYNSNATVDDGTCILPDPINIPYCIGVDFSTIANHIYGPITGPNNFSTTNNSGVALNDEHPLLDSDPFKDGVNIEDVVASVTAKISFQQLSGVPVGNSYDLPPEYSTADLTRETNLDSRSHGLQYSSQGVISVDSILLDQAYKARATIEVIFSQQFSEVDMQAWLDDMYAETDDALWTNINQSIPNVTKSKFTWNVPIYDAAESDLDKTVKDFILEDSNYLLTNAVGFKSLNGIKAGSRATNDCLTSSMTNGSLLDGNFDAFTDYVDTADNASGTFKDIAHLLFPGFGFGCDTPHVRVSWRGSNVSAGKRSAPAKTVFDFRESSEWIHFQELFEDITVEDVPGELTDGGGDAGFRGVGGGQQRVFDDPEAPEFVYVFFTTNFNDPIYEASGYVGSALQSQINQEFPPSTTIYYYGTAAGAPTQAIVNSGLLVDYPLGPSLNGTSSATNDPDDVVAGGSYPTNWFYFPRTEIDPFSIVSAAYRPTAQIASLDTKNLEKIGNRSLAQLGGTDFNYQHSVIRAFPNSGTSTASDEQKINGGGLYEQTFNVFLSGEGTLRIANKISMSVRQPSLENPQQATGFYEFNSGEPPESVGGSLYAENSSGVYSIADDYFEILGIGGSGSGTIGETHELGALAPSSGSVPANGRIYIVGFKAFLQAQDQQGESLEYLRITSGSAPPEDSSNLKYRQANPSVEDRTVDGVRVTEEFTADTITLGDEPTSSDGNGASAGGSNGTTNTTTKDATPINATPALITPTSSSSTKKKATKKYGY